jgi:hypothetical protein
MKLVKVAHDHIINLESVATAKFADPGKEPGGVRKGTSGVTLTISYQSGQVGKLHGDDARELWEALQRNCEPNRKG